MKVHCLYDKLVDPRKLKAHPLNHNKHPQDQIERLASILQYQGWRYAVKVSKRSGCVTAGHGRIEAARHNGWESVPVVYQEYETDEQEYADVQADNAIASWAELDLSGINLDIPDLGPDFDIEMLGLRNFTIEPMDNPALTGGEAPTMADKFMLPPFTVLNAREGWWQNRKRHWLAMGIKSELGRGGGASEHDSRCTMDAGEVGQNTGTTIGAIPPNQKQIMKRSGTYKRG